MKKLKYSICSLAIVPNLLLATQLPNSSDAARSFKAPKEVQKKEKALVEVEGKEIYKPMLKDDKSGEKFLVKAFTFTHNKSIDTKVLQDVVKEYENKEHSFSKLQYIASLVTKKYKDEGYFISRAYLPIQKLENNILEISIIEGKYGEFVVDNKSSVNDFVIEKFLSGLKDDEVVTSASLDRTLLLLNELPGVRISNASIKAGSKVGTSDFSIVTEKEKPYSAYVIADNLGSRYTGEKRLLAGGSLYSPFKIGDEFSFLGLVSNGQNIKNVLLSYEMPLNSDGLRGKLSYSDVSYNLTKEYSNLDALGETNKFELSLSYPILKTRLSNLDLTTSVELNDITDEIRSTSYENEKESKVLRVGLDYSNNDLKIANMNHILNSNIKFSYGDLTFKDETQKNIDSLGANTQGNFSKVEVGFDSNLLITPKISLETKFKAQHTLRSKNLDGSEDFSIGGAYGVKLYPSGELSAENGYLFNIEAKYELPNVQALNHKLGLFYDMGRVHMTKSISSFKARTLKDLGVGYYFSYNDIFGRVQAAWKIDEEDITSEPNQNSKVLFMLGASF